MRIALEQADCPLEVVHINEPSPIESSAYLLKYDSVHGEWARSIESSSNMVKNTGEAGLYAPH